MLCPKCGQDRHPTIEIAQAAPGNKLGIGASNGFVYICGNGACHHELGSVIRDVAPTVDAHVSPTVQTPPASPPAAHSPRPVSLVAAVGPSSHIDRMRARLAELAPLAEEYALLRRALKAIDKPARAAKSNVVPITKASAP